MAVILDIRNPEDLANTFDEIEVQRGVEEDGSDMADIETDLPIDLSLASDLSTGYTYFNDPNGQEGVSRYRWRYKSDTDSIVSNYSDIVLAGTSFFHTRFRRRMRDTDSNRYYFTDEDISVLLTDAIAKLNPHTYIEVIDESIPTNNTTRKYSFPVGINRIDDIELIDNRGDVQIHPTNYIKRARQLIFDNPLPSGYTMRLYADKFFTKPSELPVTFDGLILDLMTLDAYQTFEADRSSYYKYTTIVVPEGGNLPSMSRAIERLTVTTDKRLNSLRRVRHPSQIKLT